MRLTEYLFLNLFVGYGVNTVLGCTLIAFATSVISSYLYFSKHVIMSYRLPRVTFNGKCEPRGRVFRTLSIIHLQLNL